MAGAVRYASALVLIILILAGAAAAQTNSPRHPTWWAKYQYLLKHASKTAPPTTESAADGDNVDLSNECGPQSETFITYDPLQATLAAGSNEIFRAPMRGYFSLDGGGTWGGVDLPLPLPLSGAHATRFGSDPSLAVDSRGSVFYSYIVVFFGNGKGVDGTELAVARSTDGGQTYPAADATYFSFDTGSSHFNDKPLIAADSNPASTFRDNIYVAWDAATGGSSSGGIRVARSIDHGVMFTVTRVDDSKGPGQGVGAIPFVGPEGEVYVAWNDFHANVIAFNRSFDGGVTWDPTRVVAPKTVAYAAAIPAESFRGALAYPACDADRSAGPHRGRLYCAWMDLTPAGATDIFFAFSNDRGASWSIPAPVADQLPFAVDRFNPWLSVDPVTGEVNVSFYDTRNDTSGAGYMTDVYFTQSADGGSSWLSPNVRVTGESSSEHDCDGLFPCPGIDYGNQYGDYEGLVSHGGVSHPIWTDSRHQLDPSAGCKTNLGMEEVFSSTVP